MQSLGILVRRAALTALAALCLAPPPASADEAFYYGRVTCSGNEALVRFTWAWNDDVPDFDLVVERGARQELDLAPVLENFLSDAFRHAVPEDPGECLLSDGRRVVLRHVGLDDGLGHGQCGADERQMFSLWIGPMKVYSRELSHNRCGSPHDIAAIIVSGSRMTECRIERDGFTGTDRGAFCYDASDRLEINLDEGEALGSLELLRAADRPFCEALVRASPQRSPALVNPAHEAWPALAHADEVDVAGAERREADSIQSDEIVLDFDNDGVLDRAVAVRRTSHYFDGQFWLVFPEQVGADEIGAWRNRLEGEPNEVSAARAAGVRAFAGDQTAFHELRYTTLTPITLDGETYLHARWAYPRMDLPKDLILRPSTTGLEEVCAWRAIPPL